MHRDFLIQKVLRPEVREDTWRASIKNAFRYSLHESDDHILLKFKRFHYWRRQGADVYTELILNKQNQGLRPDLVIVLDKSIFIEEIVCSEKEESIVKKRKTYPFKISVFNTKGVSLKTLSFLKP